MKYYLLLIGFFYYTTFALADGCTSVSFSMVATPNSYCSFDFQGISVQNTDCNYNQPYTYFWDFGDGSALVYGTLNPQHQYFASGTYTVTLTFQGICHGTLTTCSSSQPVTVVIPPPPPITSSTSIYSYYDQATSNYIDFNVSCFGASDGWISLGSIGSYTYEWQTTPPQYGSNINNLTAGSYNVLSILNGCPTQPLTFNLVEPPQILANQTITNASCYSYNNGDIDLAVIGGISPYNYLWSNGDTTEDLSNLVAGTYSVNIIDTAGCIETFTFQVTEPTPLQTTIAASTDYNGYHVSCNGYSDGGIDLSVSGSVPGYTYLWNTFATTEDITSLPMGTYSVDITDLNSCTTSTSFTLTEPTPFQTTIAASTDYNGYNISCNGYSDGGVDLSVSGSVPGYTYLWNTFATTEDITSLPMGTYSVDITDINSCTTSTVFTLTEPTPLQTTITASTDYNGYNISCNGYSDGGIDLSVSGSVPGYTYLWNTSAITEDITSLPMGTYSVEITDLNSCTTSTSFTLTEPTPLQTTIAASTDYNGYNISCNGYSDGGIDLGVSGSVPGYTYLWNTSAITEDIINLPMGTYSVDITDINSCTTSTVLTLTEPTPLQTIVILSDINGYNICNQGQDGFIDLTVSGSVPGYSYQWSNGDTTEDINNLGAGIYSYTATDQNDCFITGSIEIIEPTLNIQETVIDVSCFDGIDGSVSVSVTGSAAPYSVFWANNINPNLLSAGVYSYQIVDSIGCNYIDSITILEPDSFSVSENIINISCNGYNDGSISLSISGATPPYVLDWAGVSTFNMTAGTYNYIITDANLCYYSEIAVVTEPNPIDVLNQIIDPSCSTTNDGSVSLLISGGTPPYTTDWGSTNPNNLGIGTYNYIITDTNNCVDSNTISVTSESNMVVIASVTDISCKGFCDGAVNLAINNGIPPYIVNWFGTNQAFICEGLVTYEVTDSVGCLHVDSIQVSAPDSVVVSITPIGMQLQAAAIGGIPPYTFQWSDDNGVISLNQIITMTNSGNYYCIAIDQNNCQSAAVRYYYTDVALTNINGTGFNIYPNPSEGFLIIEYTSIQNSDLTLNLIDVLGQYVHLDTKKSFTGEYKNQIDLANYAKGVYFINIKLNNQDHYKKLILQ